MIILHTARQARAPFTVYHEALTLRMASALPHDDAKKVEGGPKKKMTIYLLLSNVKAFDSFCEVELQVWSMVIRRECTKSDNHRYTDNDHYSGQKAKMASYWSN